MPNARTTPDAGVARPSRDDLLRALEERQKDLEQEIADIHDVIRRLRDEGVQGTPEPQPSADSADRAAFEGMRRPAGWLCARTESASSGSVRAKF